LIEAACRIANQGEIVLFVRPTKELIDKTIAEQLSRQQNPPAHEAFYGSSLGRSVAWELTEHLKDPPDGGHIIFATHQVLPFVRFWPNQSRLHVFIDEELQVVKHGSFKIPHTHKIITDCIELEAYHAIFGRVIISDPDQLELIAKNEAGDELYERLREQAQILNNPHWESFVNAEHFEKLMEGYIQQLSIHSVLSPDVLDGFASVTMASANFRDTLVYRLWRLQGVRFQEDTHLTQALRFQKHENVHFIMIKYLTDRPWSRKLQRTPRGPDSENSQTVLTTMIQAVEDEFGEHPFLWQPNKSVGDGVFGSHARRLPNVPHWLNDYSDYDRIAFLSAVNPKTDHFRFLASRGVDADAVRRAIYGSAVYQSVMRTSIRNPESSTKKTLIVPDAIAARYLAEAFPGSQVEKLQTGLFESEGQTKRGRPRKYDTRSEQEREYRQRKKQSALKTALRLGSVPYVGEKSCCDEGVPRSIRDENGIELTTHFITHLPCHGSLYNKTTSKTPSGYLSGRNTELFLGFLEHLHKRTVESKDTNPLISPAIFDPNHPKAEGKTKRGLQNIVAMRHLWMDFENGDLPPEEIAKTVSTYSLSGIQHLQSHERKSTMPSSHSVRQANFRRGLHCYV
jgi:hypothetical protein